MSGSFEFMRCNACERRLHLGLCSHPKVFLRNGVRTHVNSKAKSLPPEKFFSGKDGTHDAASSRTASPTRYQRAIPASYILIKLSVHFCCYFALVYEIQ